MAERASLGSITHLVAGVQLCVVANGLPCVLRLLRVCPWRAFHRHLARWLATRGTKSASKRVPMAAGLLEPVLRLRLRVYIWRRVMQVPGRHAPE